MNKPPQPPKLPLRFFRWYCHPDYQEDIEGDLRERFGRRSGENGIRSARWRFSRDVLALCRPGIIRSFIGGYQPGYYDMFRNNFKVASRNLLKHKFYSLINVLGLATGMTCSLLIFLYVSHELSYDSFHEKRSRIYRIVTDIKTPTETLQVGVSSAPMAAYMKADFPEVEDMVRLDDAQVLLKIDGKTFHEDNAMLADPSFFDIFTFPFIMGDPETALHDPFSVVLTENAAKKYFGEENPIGKILRLEGEYDLTVMGVIKNIPENSNFTFDVLLSMSIRLEKLYPEMAERWGNFGYQSYVLLSEQADPALLEEKLPGFMEKYAGKSMERDNMFYTLFLEPLTDVYLRSEREGPKSGNLANVILFSVIAGFILLIACFNFINLSTARAAERAREVGIRRTVGAQRWQLTLQFLCEAFLMSALAFLITLIAGHTLLPAFNQLSGKEIASSIFQDIPQLFSFCMIAMGIGLLAGFYPALVLSRFRPISILKGRFGSSQTGITLRKILVTTQFIISIALIAGTVVVYEQLSFMRNHALGFKKDHVLVIDFHGDDAIQGKIEALKQELGKSPNILSVSVSSSVPGHRNSGAFTEIENPSGDLQASNLDLFFVDHSFLHQYEMELIAGRGFSHDFPSDTSALIINEATMASYGYRHPNEVIGKRFSQWGMKGKIIGVVRDYHFKSLQEKITPLTIRLKPDNAHFISLSLNSDDIAGTVSSLEQKWQTLSPERPFDYFFLDDSFDRQYRTEVRFGRLFIYFAGLAIFIACLGLLGLISYTVLQCMREIGIRKVFGATRISIVKLLTQGIMKLVLFALVIAIPVTWLSLSKWLQGFAYQIEITGWVFVLAGITAVTVTFFTIGYHALRAALANPADTLRNE